MHYCQAPISVEIHFLNNFILFHYIFLVLFLSILLSSAGEISIQLRAYVEDKSSVSSIVLGRERSIELRAYMKDKSSVSFPLRNAWLPTTPGPRDLMPPSGPYGHCTQGQVTTQRYISIYIIKINLKKLYINICVL